MAKPEISLRSDDGIGARESRMGASVSRGTSVLSVDANEPAARAHFLPCRRLSSLFFIRFEESGLFSFSRPPHPENSLKGIDGGAGGSDTLRLISSLRMAPPALRDLASDTKIDFRFRPLLPFILSFWLFLRLAVVSPASSTPVHSKIPGRE